jgi:pilus assembly protein Flp/PilA
MKRFLRDERGATAIEYALIASIISLVIVGGATMIGTSLRSSYEQVATGLITTR